MTKTNKETGTIKMKNENVESDAKQQYTKAKTTLKLLKFATQKGFKVFCDYETKTIFIKNMDNTNISYISTNNNINLNDNSNLYELEPQHNKSAFVSKFNYLLKEKTLFINISLNEYSDLLLNINGFVLEFHKSDKYHADTETRLNKCLEYKHFSIPTNDLKQLVQLKQNIEIECKPNNLKLSCDAFTKEYETTKTICIDFVNKYDYKYLGLFFTLAQALNVNLKNINMDIARDAPIKLYADDLVLFVAPKANKD
jgi:hypothetical protein